MTATWPDTAVPGSAAARAQVERTRPVAVAPAPVSGSASAPVLTPPRRTHWNAVELLAAKFPDPRWAVPGLVAEGLTLFVGAPKVGKSWAAWNLAVAIASGGIAFGKIDVDQGDVLYLALEDTGRRLQSRLRKVLAGAAPPERLTISTTCLTLGNGGAEEIGRWLTAHPDARLVIVDVFARIRGRSGPQSSAYESDYGPMSVLKALADEHGVAILVVHHTRKADAEDFLDVVSGTQGLAGAADCIVVLKRSRGTADGVLHVTGRDVEEAEYALKFSAELGAWEMLDGPAADYSLGDTRQRILRHVREHGAATPKQVADTLGINYETAKKTCRRMSDDGQLDTDGSGTYLALPVPVPAVPAVPEDASSQVSEGAHEGHPQGQVSLDLSPHTHSVPLSDLEGQQGHEGQGHGDTDGRHHVVQRLVEKRGWDQQHAVTTVDAAYSRLRNFRSPSEMFDRIDNNPERYRPATS